MSLIDHKKEILDLFECQQTGKCCRCPGYVYVTKQEIQNMSSILDQTPHDFRQQYVKKDQGWDTIATPDFRPNCFLDKKNACKVYKARPKACKTYPNWPSIWESEVNLLKETQVCAGLKLAVKKLLNKTM